MIIETCVYVWREGDGGNASVWLGGRGRERVSVKKVQASKGECKGRSIRDESSLSASGTRSLVDVVRRLEVGINKNGVNVK